MPPWPIRSPFWYGGPSDFAWAAVAATTVPVSSAMEPDWAAAVGELSAVPSEASTAPRAGQTACSANRSPAFSRG